MGASFGKTKLVKLLYLIDVETYRRRSRTLSGVKWLFLHYRPYASEIDEALRQLELDIPQEDVITAAGRRAVVFRPSWDVGAEFRRQASSAERLVVNRLLSEWGTEDLNPILSHVYFHTEPMRGAKRGDVLEFSKIRQTPTWKVSRRPKEVPAGRLKELRAQFETVRRERLQQARGPLDPEPRLDDIFLRGLTHLDNEEQYSVPTGDIELPEEFKGQLRQQAEAEQ